MWHLINPDKSDKAKSDVVKLFKRCNAQLIQMISSYTNPSDSGDLDILALTDTNGLEHLAGEFDALDEINGPKPYGFFGLGSDKLVLMVGRSSELPIYDLYGFEVERERPDYNLKVAAFKEHEDGTA